MLPFESVIAGSGRGFGVRIEHDGGPVSVGFALDVEMGEEPVEPAANGGLVSSGRRRPGANLPKGLEPRVTAETETQQAQTMDEALTLTRSADSVASSLSGLQAAFQRAERDSPRETLENLEETAEGIL